MNEIAKRLRIEPAFDDSEEPLRADRVRILAILNADLSRRDVHVEQSTQLFSDPQWLGIVYRAYLRAAKATAPSAPAS
jgi:hypothetical protein